MTCPSTEPGAHAGDDAPWHAERRRTGSGGLGRKPLSRPRIGASVDVELIAFGVDHRDGIVVETFLGVRVQPCGAEQHEPRRLRLDPLAPRVERGTTTVARVHVDVDSVLDRLRLGNDLEPDARTLPARVLYAVGADADRVLRDSDRPIEVVLRVEVRRRRRYDVVQRRSPEARQRFG